MKAWLLSAVRLSARLMLVSFLAACWSATAQSRAPIPEGIKPIKGHETEVLFTRTTGQAGRYLALLHANAGKDLCPAVWKKPYIVEPDYEEKIGTNEGYVYKSKNAVTTISTTWGRKKLSGSPCHFAVESDRTWTTTIFDGISTRTTTYYLDKGTANTRKIAGRAPELAVRPADVVKPGSDARLVGEREFAQLTCNLWETTRVSTGNSNLGDTVMQICVTGKPKWPPSDDSLGLYFLQGSEFKPYLEWTAVQVIRTAVIGSDIFSPPHGVFKLNEAKAPVVVEEPDE